MPWQARRPCSAASARSTCSPMRRTAATRSPSCSTVTGSPTTRCARIANWTNLSETHVRPPADAAGRRLPGADLHPEPRAALRRPSDARDVSRVAAGRRPADGRRHRAGVRRRTRAGAPGRRPTWRSPRLPSCVAARSTTSSSPTLTAAAGIDPATVVAAEWVDNGPGWIALLLDSVEAVLAAAPDDRGRRSRSGRRCTRPALTSTSRSGRSSPRTAWPWRTR